MFCVRENTSNLLKVEKSVKHEKVIIRIKKAQIELTQLSLKPKHSIATTLSQFYSHRSAPYFIGMPFSNEIFLFLRLSLVS